jgi:uncharacterized protein (DUF1778 family)
MPAPPEKPAEKPVDADRRHFTLAPEEWLAFNRALDEPPQPNARLKALMTRKPSWESGYPDGRFAGNRPG